MWTDSHWSKEGRRALAENEEQEAMEEANSDDDEEVALTNGNVPSNPVRVLDALAENNDAEQSAVCTAQLDRASV